MENFPYSSSNPNPNFIDASENFELSDYNYLFLDDGSSDDFLSQNEIVQSVSDSSGSYSNNPTPTSHNMQVFFIYIGFRLFFLADIFICA